MSRDGDNGENSVDPVRTSLDALLESDQRDGVLARRARRSYPRVQAVTTSFGCLLASSLGIIYLVSVDEPAHDHNLGYVWLAVGIGWGFLSGLAWRTSYRKSRETRQAISTSSGH